MALCMCLFAACSQEEVISDAGQGGKVVNMTVGVPGGATTRAIPSENGYKLRCIMQVVNGSNAAIAGEGMRQVKEVTTEKVTFTFTAPEGDYKCLFWADFVTDVNADYVYKTTDLASITYNKTDNALFSTAADAFCGYVANGSTTIQLKRPFAKVAVAPKNAGSFTGFNKLTVSYNAPSGFNMVTKAVSSTAQKVTYTNTSFNATSGSWFTSFIFAPSNVGKLDSDITMQLGGTESKTLTISADKVPLTENYEINGMFDATEGNDVNVDVSFDNEFDKPEVKAPAVGDYLYADGTWGAATTGAGGVEAVGVVFHVEPADAPLDNVDNYSGITFANNKIRGWVVALKATATVKTAWCSEKLTTFTTGVTLQKTADDVKGYSNSKALAADGSYTYPINDACLNWEPSAPAASSGWYLPAINQVKTLQTNKAAVNTSLAKITDAEAIIPTTANTILWSSTFFGEGTQGEDVKVYQLIFQTSAADSSPKSATTETTGFARAILTF